MKKITFLTLFLALLSWQGMAQFTEGFEGVGTPAGWTVINNNADAELWYFTTPGAGTANGGTQVARIDYNASVAHDDYLVTPQIAVVDQNTDRLTLFGKSRSASFLEDFNILISTTGTNVGDFSIQLTPTITAPATWTQYQYDLSAYEGQNIYIAFQAVSLNEWELYIDDVTIDGMPACPDPTMLTASNITATTANLGWTNPSASTWDIEYGTTPFTPTGTPTIAGTTTNPHNLTGLTASTSYEFYVRADCGGSGTSNWVGPFAFTTACNAFTIPFTETFSSTSTTQSCWTVINNNNDADMWNMDYTTNPLAGDEVAIMYTDGNAGANDDYLVTPTLTLTGNERLRFSYRVQSAGEPNDIQITLSTTGVGVGNFSNTLLPLTTVSNTTYQEQIINLSAYTGNVNIAFHVPSGGLDGWRLYIDSVVVEAIPACPDPTALNVTNLTTTTADLGWTEMGSATTWDIEYGATPFTPTGTPTITGTTTNPHNLTGLTANTSYEYYVRADCGGSGTSNWVGPFAFYTGHCPVVSTASGSYMDDFSTTGGSTNISNLTSGYATAGYEDATSMAVTSFPTGSVNFTTAFVGTTVGYNIWVDWNNDLDFNDPGETVYASAGYVSAASGTITVPGATAIGNYRMRMRCDFNATNPNACGASGSGRNETEDYTFTVVAPPACLQPSAQTVTNLTATSADLGWTDNAGASTWDIEYGATPFTPTGTPNVVGTTTNPHNLTGLTASTSYEYYVRADCGGSGTSTWEGPFSFTTACSAPVISSFPYSEDFDSETTPNVPCGWIISNDNGDGSEWITSTSNPNSGANSLYLEYDASQASNDWIFTPELQLIGGNSYDLRFAYRSRGTSFLESMSVWLGSARDSISMTTMLFDSTNFGFTSYDTVMVSFTVPTTASYFIGFFGYSNANEWGIYVDDFYLNTGLTTSINDLDNISLNVYPNPNNGEFTLNVNTTDVNELAIRVVNLQGKEVYFQNSFTNLNSINERIDLSDNSSGIYFVIVTTDKGIVTHKMIVK